MKTYIDLEATYRNLFLSSKRMKNRLIKYWGTETIDGVEVFKSKFVVWPNTERTSSKKILKMFGLWDQIYGQKFEGITEYYLTFNQDKLSNTTADDLNTQILVTQLNQYLEIGESFTVNINVVDDADPERFSGWNKQQILDYVDTNYSDLVDDTYVDVVGDTMSKEVIGKYVLLDDGTTFEVEVVTAQVTPIAKNIPRSNLVYRQVYYISGINVVIKATQIAQITEDSQIISAIKSENDQLALRKLKILETSTNNTRVFDWNFNTSNDNEDDYIWYKGQLRVATTNSYYLPRNEFTASVLSSLDTGYKKKKTSWWKKLISIVVVVLVVYFSGGTAGWAAAIEAGLSAVAINLGIAMLVLSAIQIAISNAGDAGLAMYFGKIVQIVGYAATVTGIAAMIQNIGRSAFMQAVSNKGLFSAVGDYAMASVKSMVGSTVVQNSTAVVSTEVASAIGQTVIPQTSFAFEYSLSKITTLGMKVVTKLINMRQDMLMEDATSQISSLTAQVDESKELLNDLTDKEVNIGVEDIKYYTKPLTLDNIIFENDYKYEGTKYNIGRPSFYPYGMNFIDK